MKKIAVLVAAMIIISVFSAISVSSYDEIKVVLDGQQIAFDQPPVIINGRTMVPMRAIFEALGATVEWNDDTKTATGRKMGISVSFTINQQTMIKNHNEIELDTPAQLVNGRTLLPVRAVSESFGIDVEWNGITGTVTLSDKNTLTTLVLNENETYEGEVLNGVPHGYGTVTFNFPYMNGTKTGSFENSAFKSGYCEEFYIEGDKFLGYRVNGVRHGYGEYYRSDGTVEKGTWENGKLVK